MAISPVCSVSDCRNPPSGRRGMCASHYQRLLVHGNPLAGRWVIPAADRVGQKFGRLTVDSIVPRGKGQKGSTRAICRCECGSVGEKDLSLVVSGHTKSCGCYNSDVIAIRNYRHGKTDTPEYTIWAGMKARCNNQQHIAYPNYGGRGISVCERWSASFEAFLEDMGNRPGPAMSLDRIDPNGNYEPDNCRWETSSVQAKNTRRARLYLFKGRSMNVPEIARETGLRASTINARLASGWSIDRAATEPLREGSYGRKVRVGNTADLLSQLRNSGTRICHYAADKIEALLAELEKGNAA